MRMYHDGHSQAEWQGDSGSVTSFNTQSKNCYKGVTGDDSTGIWFSLGSRTDPTNNLSDTDKLRNYGRNIYKIDADGGITAKCIVSQEGYMSTSGGIWVNDQEKLICQQSSSAHCISLNGTTFTHHWTVGNGMNAQGHSNAPYNYHGDGWPNESLGGKGHTYTTWHWAASDKLWYWSEFKEQMDGGGASYYGSIGGIPVNVSSGAWDTNFTNSGNFCSNYQAQYGPHCVQTVNGRTYMAMTMWNLYRNSHRVNSMHRWDTNAQSYSSAYTGPYASSNHAWDRLITYSPGNWGYTNSAYDNNFFHIWVHDTGSSEKIYVGGKKKQYSSETSNSYSGNWGEGYENNFVGKIGNDNDQFDWCSNLHGGNTSTYGSQSMDVGGSDPDYGGVMSVRPDGNGNCISVHASQNHVVSGKREILIAKWNDTTGALISVYGIACITSGYNWKDGQGYAKGCLTTPEAVYINVWTEATNANSYRGQPIILKMPHDIGNLAGNHTVGGLTFTIGAATGVTQGSQSKNRIGFAEDGYNPIFNTAYDQSRDTLLSGSGNGRYSLESGYPSTSTGILDLK